MKEEAKSTGTKRCPHKTVKSDVALQDGEPRSLRACVACGQTFVSSAMFERAERVAYHLCTIVAAMAADAVKDSELREVARLKILDHLLEATRKQIEAAQ